MIFEMGLGMNVIHLGIGTEATLKMAKPTVLESISGNLAKSTTGTGKMA